MAKVRIAPNPNVGRNIDALMRATPGLETQPALAKRTGVGQTTIGRILRGEVSPTAENLRLIAAAFDVDVGELYRPHASFVEAMGARALSRPLSGGVSSPTGHNLSHFRPILELRRVPWEQLMDADLSQPFELVVIDDALAPEIVRGCVARLDPGRQPEAGRPVLVQDAAGRFHLRDYQVGPGGRWQAVARQRGFAPLDSEADGLRLVAVMKGFDWP